MTWIKVSKNTITYTMYKEYLDEVLIKSINKQVKKRRIIFFSN